VFERTSRTADAAEKVSQGAFIAAAVCVEEAAEADGLDSLSAGDAARVRLAACPRGKEAERQARAVADCLFRAESWATEAARRDPAASENWRLMAQVAWLRAQEGGMKYVWTVPTGSLEDVAARLRGDLSREPDNEVVMFRLAEALGATGDDANAVALYEAVAARDPRCPIPPARSGDASWRAGRIDDAWSAWRRADRVAPRNEHAQRALGAMEQAMKLNPRDMRLRIAFADMLCAAGRPREALGQIEAARGLDRALSPESIQHIAPAEDRALGTLQARAETIMRARAPESSTAPAR
jgi:tetratricopeptide (TPR) repeat protein